MFKISNQAYWLDPSSLVASNYAHNLKDPDFTAQACGPIAPCNTFNLPSKAPDSVKAQGSRIRKRSRASSDDALDAKYPDNIRHRAIISYLQQAHASFFGWWQQQQEQQQQQSKPHQTQDQKQELQAQQLSEDQPSLGGHKRDNQGPVDWIALAASSHQHLYLSQYNQRTPQALVTQPSNRAPAQSTTIPLHISDRECTTSQPVPLTAALKHQPGACSSLQAASLSWSSPCPHRDQLHGCSQSTSFPLFDHIHSNTCAEEVLATTAASLSMLPRFSRFLMSDISRISTLIKDGSKYRLILLDPPWENKSVQRSGSYPTLFCRTLLSLPVPQLLVDSGGVVAMWMTNRGRLHRFVERELLPAWGMTCVATWWWLKCATDGQPMTPLSSQHRHPYESLVLLRRTQEKTLHQNGIVPDKPGHPAVSEGMAVAAAATIATAAQTKAATAACAAVTTCAQHCVQDREVFEDGVVLFSPRDLTHSRKPQIGKLLWELVNGYSSTAPEGAFRLDGLPEQGSVAGRTCINAEVGRSLPLSVVARPIPCLELFAREMQAGWTSWGNEVLRFQDAHLFKLAETPQLLRDTL